ncbi:hypothetical protein [Nocardiopsis potens]|uniref:hypothetical protein n=1 Tax=Nocardiopsis potens TaxID=1246458 RepID=UPI0003498113|nr:hypothetical protein [Nocardiopsis potens]
MLRHPRVAAFLRWLPFIIIAANLFLVFAGVVNVAQAAVLIAVLEACLLGVVIAEFAAIRIAFRKARARGASRVQAAMASLDACLPPSVAFLVKQELLVTLAFPRLFRRRSPDPGTTALPSSGPTGAISIGMLAVTVPGCALSLLFVGGPDWLRWVLFGVSLYFAFYAVGLWALYDSNGHLVGPRTLRVRHGATTDVAFPLDEAASVRVSPEAHRSGPVSVDGGTLTVTMFGRTNVAVEFASPVPAVFFDRDEAAVTRVRFFADSPERAVAAIEERLSRTSR